MALSLHDRTHKTILNKHNVFEELYVCVRVCVCVCVCVCMYVCIMYVCMYVCMYVYIYGIFILKIISKYLPVG